MTLFPTPDVPPRWLWIATLLGVGVVLAVIAVTALIIASGATDHPVAGPVVWSDRAFAWTDGAHSTFDDDTAHWWTAPQTLPAAGAFTLTVRATLTAGADPLAGWGVWIAGEDGSRALYAISAGGYWTIRACPADALPGAAIEQCPALHPAWRWSPFPPINAPGTPNTLTLHREPDGAIRLRINHELLGAPQCTPTGVWGVWARGGADVLLRWDYAELRTADMRPATKGVIRDLGGWGVTLRNVSRSYIIYTNTSRYRVGL